ncbi:hypothetical protein [Thermus hydrothermalis]|uniref:hypothetical protein n=1 Tax=Thermus hydrothermalis TaxID=2908148 RepID=UPI001FA9451D|nr:hypothetical protein [Thermus hydrothermalis]
MKRIEIRELKGKDILALVRFDCEECGGTGVVEHPLWKQYWDEWRALGKPKSWLEQGHIDTWFSERGEIPPEKEEIDCPLCEGTGKREAWLPVAQVLEELGCF